MPDRSDVVYLYDGSFEGLLCCVFESYDKREIPSDICRLDVPQATLFPMREIGTEPEKAARVLRSIPQKMGAEALLFVQKAFLTFYEKKELYILLFLRLGYKHGPSVMSMLADDVVHTLFKAVKHLDNESHRMKEFLRFSEFNGVLVAEMEPYNTVLPMIKKHFCERFPNERFLIFDRSHGMALVHEPGRSAIIPMDELETPSPDEEEYEFRELWRLFYNTIEVPGRHNEKLRMTLMPKRYWKYMTEFQTDAEKALKNPSGRSLPEGKDFNN